MTTAKYLRPEMKVIGVGIGVGECRVFLLAEVRSTEEVYGQVLSLAHGMNHDPPREARTESAMVRTESAMVCHLSNVLSSTQNCDDDWTWTTVLISGA